MHLGMGTKAERTHCTPGKKRILYDYNCGTVGTVLDILSVTVEYAFA